VEKAGEGNGRRIREMDIRSEHDNRHSDTAMQIDIQPSR